MAIRTYKIAGVNVQINSVQNTVHAYCDEYRTYEAPELEIVTTQADIDFEREKSRQEDILEGLPVKNHSDYYLEILAVYRKMAEKLLYRDILLFHGSAIAVDGEAVLFTAKSGTGKSTHTRLWREQFGDRCVMVNDDKPLLKVTEEGVSVYGTPWDGKHRLSTNCQMPLKSICILERGEQNVIQQITAKEALTMLMQQSFRPASAADTMQMMKVVDKMTKKLSFYRLQCNMEPEAAQVSYQAMLGK